MTCSRRSPWMIALVLVAVVGFAPSARADEIHPAIYVLVDTSGSMIATPGGVNTYGDGSTEHPHNAAGQSRLFMAKNALASVIYAYGEVQWGLARFKQLSGVNQFCMCHQQQDNQTTGACAAPNGPGLNQERDANGNLVCETCDMKTAYPDYDLEGVNDRVCINYVGGIYAGCTYPLGGTVLDGADILVHLAEDNENKILMWIDHHETAFRSGTEAGTGDHCFSSGVMGDCELRGVAGTPIGGSLHDLYDNLSTTAIGNDDLRGCRPYSIIVLTDGANSCTTNPVTWATHLRSTPDLQHTCASDADCPSDSTCDLGLTPHRCTYDVRTHVIAFAVSAIERQQANQIAAAGGTTAAIPAADEDEIASAMAEIIADAIKPELCNGVDDDCDGEIDEGFNLGATCNNGGKGVCFATGTIACDPGDVTGTICQVPAGTPNPGDNPEVCDGLDNDCDGEIDEGGVCSCQGPEFCDGVDNYCDGHTTAAEGAEDPNAGQACGSSVGWCTIGTTYCGLDGGVWKILCSGRGPEVEVCDSNTEDHDQNCNGVNNDGVPPRACSQTNTHGTCSGLESCDPNGAWVNCSAPYPAAESCNNRDDNCNGQIDEGLTRGCAVSNGFGTCSGSESCSAGAWVGCTAATPAVETCDSVDNDCDGSTDEGLTQPCQLTNSHGTCEGIETCTGGTYVGTCNAKTPAPETCNALDDDCDGLIDEGVSRACYSGPPLTENVGLCHGGNQACTLGTWGACAGEVIPTTERCNGLDDDCDGTPDDDLGSTTCGVGKCTHTVPNCVDGVAQTCDPYQGAVPETCNNQDDDCDGVVDGLSETCYGLGTGCTFAGGVWTCVGTCGTGTRTCPTGSGGLWGACQFATGPATEQCDGLDNDCDGAIDEDLTRACYPAGYGPTTGCTAVGTCVGACHEGTQTCGAGAWGACGGAVTPIPETCDGVDNDCNGAVDDGLSRACTVANGFGTCGGVETCAAGGWIGCTAKTPAAETCNGLDDDCDGQIDEGLTRACSVTNASGTCSGTETCNAGTWVGCTAKIPAAEVCNNQDDNCNGQIDESVTQTCYDGPAGTLGVGECHGGTRTCTAGSWSGCVGQVMPTTETCDTRDNDCDGVADDGLGSTTCGLGSCAHTIQNCVGGVTQTCNPLDGAVPETCDGADNDCDGVADGLVEACYTPTSGCTETSPGVFDCEGACQAGARTCPVGSGAWGTCQGDVGPAGETCNGVDDDCDGAIDEDLVQACYPAGYGATTGCTAAGTCVGTCHEGTQTCTAGAWAACAGAVTPVEETCDGTDNDCDGQIDEGLTRPCTITNGNGTCGGVETCALGVWGACTARVPAPETCNNQDDDCDGQVDENLTQACQRSNAEGTCSGTETCNAGTWVGCNARTPAAELCNNQDDNCNGQIDESLTQACYDGPAGSNGVGECHGGTRTCTAGTWSGCAGQVLPVTEVCDSKDNDCDGLPDDGLGSTTCGAGACAHTVPNCVGGSTQACDPYEGAAAETCDGQDNDCDGVVDGLAEACFSGTSGCTQVSPGVYACVGACHAGTHTCPVGSGTWGQCQGEVVPVAEVCDGIDNDCDGDVDENLVQACYPSGYGATTGCTAPGTCRGVCAEGTRTCAAGGWGVCVNPVLPSAELCDGLDNDCDGLIDEDVTRPCTSTNAFGTCRGVETCTTNAWGACNAPAAAAESCNGLDDNCDGRIDEGLSQACYDGPVATRGVGACRDGVQTCATGSWGSCQGQVQPGVEICDGIDNDCDGLVDEDDGGQPLTSPCYTGPAGTQGVGTCHAGVRTCTGGAWSACAGEVVPRTETCDGLDNDCDGVTDENLGETTCGLGHCQHTVPNCIGGVPQTCDPYAGAQPEVCDGLDNDCDGIADGIARTCYGADLGPGCTETTPGQWTCVGTCATGLQVCAAGGAGTWGECRYDIGPATEVCDGLDNDCDGQTDEDAAGQPLSQACYPPGSGASTGCVRDATSLEWTCQGLCQVGTRTCETAAWGDCVGHVTPSVEVCDATDNDCDGVVDEPEDIPGLDQPCSTALGRCTPGLLRCWDGVETCEGGEGPFPGECNGEDDDCDGEIDEPDEVAAFEGQPCGDATGVCEPGQTQCVGGAIQCVGGVQPGEEVCDGLDNDCDGEVDDQAPCPSEYYCVQAECRPACDPSEEFPCPGSLICTPVTVEGADVTLCLPPVIDDCGGVICPNGWICVNEVCTDPCDPSPCDWWETCNAGNCLDTSCTGAGHSCDPGEFCIDHGCVPDPCLAAACDPAGEFCQRDCDASGCTHTCQPVCLCDVGERCAVGGVCEPDLCVDTTCPSGNRCDPATGDCEPDPCYLVSCTGATTCHEGACVDNPCASAMCPLGFSCEPRWSGETGAPVCVPDEGVWTPGSTGPKYLATGGGGVSCSTSGGADHGAPLVLLLALGTLWAIRRRRRAVTPLLVLVGVLGLGAAGCKIDPWQQSTDGALVQPDARTDDAGPADARPPDACVPTDEICNGLDEDCDGVPDNGFDLQTDPRNCGTCGHLCEFPYVDESECVAGECHPVRCQPGHWDLNELESDGCEYACFQTNNAVESCDGVDNDCDGAIDEDFDLDVDPLNCGQCNRTCAFFQGVGGCAQGQCVLSSCRGGFVDKDGDPDNGCECMMDLVEGPTACTEGVPGDCSATEVCADPDRDGVAHCAAIPADVCDGVDNDCDGVVDEDAAATLSGVACYTHPVGCTADGQGGYTCAGTCRTGLPTCVGGLVQCGGQVAPSAETCDGTDNDCNGVIDDGYDKLNDPANCGGCGVRCATVVTHGVPGCALGQCTVVACLPGYWDLNGDPLDGCEYACTYTSGGVERCGDGIDNDCDGQVDEGFDYTADVQNCGTCGNDCGTGKPFGTRVVGCTAGACQYACLADHFDRDGDLGLGKAGNGCEYGCVATNGGTEACDGLDNDCNGTVDEGFDKLGDVSHCGGCDQRCADQVGAHETVTGCVNGVCRFACEPGYVDVTGDLALGSLGNGCECPITNGGVEICDGLDNDCDGQIDEDAAGVPLVQACYTGAAGTENVGPCRGGSQVCGAGGTWGPCQGEVLPAAAETCDGVDNDCDGQLDEDAAGAPLAQACYTGPAGTENVGPCRGGSQACTAGAWGACTGQVTPQVETCDGADNDCDGQSDEDYTVATDPQNCGSCGYRCAAHVGAFSTATGCAAGACQFACLPNHYDHDGDVGLGDTGTGCEYACVLTNGGVERCGDAVDNDCDGQIDEGFDFTAEVQNCGTCGHACAAHAPFGTTATGCAGGVCQFACLPTYYDLNGDLAAGEAGNGCEYTCTVSNGGTEACDNLDNDCDGAVDEGFDKQGDPLHCGSCNYACAAHVGAGSVVTGCTSGVCQFACAAGFVDRNGDVSLGNLGNGCEYACTQSNGGTEICDGLDNDCDGQIDENASGGPLTESCYTGTVGTAGTGPCRTGTRTCQVPGGWTACTGEVTPQPETCDGIDNDCDGSTDEADLGGPLTRSCYTGPAGTENVGPCRGGSQTCSVGAWSACTGQVTPQVEACDGVDNDCDGTNNEGFTLATDMQNCGACGNRCTASVGAFSTATGCVGGVCQFACQAGHHDLNGDVALGASGTGCEYACVITNGGVERCGDGVDNDCDGQTDEGFTYTADPQNCGSCGYACASHTPFGTTSTGCASGTCQFTCLPSYYDLNGDLAAGEAGNGCEYTCTVSNGGTEACDSLDNDCDGTIDEGFDKQTSTAHCGSCNYACAAHVGAGSVVTGCTNGVCQFACASGFVDRNGDVSLGDLGNGCEYACAQTNGGTEICDGLDNDCDGAIDENATGGPLTETCYTGTVGTAGTGPCRTGTRTCQVPGGWTACTGEVTPQPESCDGIDNDCDGETDEASPGVPLTQACYTGPSGTQSHPPCKGGTQTCSGGAYGACVGQVTPQLEICDTVDNDCDGTNNEGFDLATDPQNCGSCGHQCSAHAGAFSTATGCVSNLCQYTCQPNHWDLDNNRHLGSGGNGCEYACIQTNGGVEACGDGVDNDCDGSIDEGFDLTTDANNCGSCGYVCASRTPPGATSTGCAASQCTFVCQAGRHDLNLDLALGIAGNGCEYSCTTTNGGVEICDNVDNDCNGVIDNGFDKQTSLDHCGSCSYACAAHAGAFSTATACVSGACQYTCQPGHYDLNGDRNLGSAGNGCEYACTVSNGGTEICDNVDNDCDGAIDESVTRACYGPGYGPATGCTAPGSCKGTCHEGIETCSAGVWQGCSGAVTPAPEICDTLDNDCDGVVNNGFDTTSDLNNCGGCNVSCWTTAPAHTYPSACVASVCQYACMSGYANLGGGPDCEYQCPVNPPTTEYCDGVDNDCDGLIDEGLTAPVGLCYQGIGGDGSDAHNPCLGVTALCQDPDGAGGLPHGWYCQYKASVERNPAAPNNLLGYETLCDGWDGDCDGTPDDNFGVGDICDNGLQGRCKVDGVVICDAGDPSTTECLLPPSAGWPDPEDEICDGVDNDCDGLTDENAHENLSATDPVGVQGFVVDSVVPIFVGGQKVFVYTYEASRPSATGATAGSGSSARACSKENVLPWANVTHAQAERACARAGLRLCQADEWFEACSGAVLAYPYGPAYNATACNGHDRDPAQDAVVATGSLATCDSVTYGIADLSGNLREWTNDVMGYTNAGKAIYTLRGGSYMDYSGGLGCGFEMSGFVEDVFAPNVGFRCCTTCGNDAVDPGETCEVGDAGCNPATCGPLTCGNGVLEVAQGEECDDGNLLPLDGCSPTCQREEESCSVLYPADEDGDGLANCADPSCAGTWCADMQDNDGDGFTEADGDCDDTNPNIHPAAVEICNDGIDNNCNGLVDRLDTVDADGDGQRRCHPTTASLDDCDDWDPTRSPRHLEKPGDGIDNDCDGSIDEAATACNNCTAGHTYADAIDACGWWVNSVTSNGDANGRGWRNDLANSTTIVPHKACSFLVMSSGHIDAYLGRGTGNNYVQEQGADLSNGNQSDPIEGTTNAFVVYDQVQVFMVLDVPTNVYSLSFDFAFFSAEYPEYVCTSFNDEFYAIIQSSHPDYNGFSCLGTMPAPPQTGQGCRNISFDGNGNKIGVNAAFFENPTSPGSMSLTGTGYEYYDDNANNCWGNLAGCVRPTYNCPDVVGGATNWLTTTANVVPGERIRLTFDIHDESDSQYDSRVVIDNFRWNFEAVSGPVTTK